MEDQQKLLFQTFDADNALKLRSDRSLVISFVAPVGVDLARAESAAEKKLQRCGYEIERIRVTKDILPSLYPSLNRSYTGEFERFNVMMDAGNQARQDHGNSVIALAVAAAISLRRRVQKHENDKVAYFIHSLKNPDEVRMLRKIYSSNFYQIGVFATPNDRRSYLIEKRNILASEAKRLMDRDQKEREKHGQRLIDTYPLSDFFVGWRFNSDESYENFLDNNISRFFEVVFGHPNHTPAFGEYAMFQAFSASLRSADLSRQVGAVITRHREILGTGANDCPKAGGGLYWQKLNRDTNQFDDYPKGRDWTRGGDANRRKLKELKISVLSSARDGFDQILRTSTEPISNIEQIKEGLIRKLDAALEMSPIADLTEFGRAVHAEMEALLSCARKGVSTTDATLYSTTFPCHNCAKHIVAAGVKRVVFIEPYMKSKAIELHGDSIEIVYPSPLEMSSEKSPSPLKKVKFEPFAGIGPRRFFDLFSMNLGVGEPMVRKDDNTGTAKKWNESDASPRIVGSSDSFLDREDAAAAVFQKLLLSLPCAGAVS